MKKTLISIALSLVFTVSANAQAVAACQTMEQQQAKYNKDKAYGIAVKDTYTQQLQCHYWQLGVYYQQLDTTNQQIAKDRQQVQKDVQQVQKDEQQKACDKALTIRMVELDNLYSEGYDEVKLFIEAVLPLLGSCDSQLKEELNRIHTNRSGGGDSTNPGGGGNLRGFDNPHKVR